jgi:hypothetical protein
MTALLKAAQTNDRRVAFIGFPFSRLKRLSSSGLQAAIDLHVVSSVNNG